MKNILTSAPVAWLILGAFVLGASLRAEGPKCEAKAKLYILEGARRGIKKGAKRTMEVRLKELTFVGTSSRGGSREEFTGQVEFINHAENSLSCFSVVLSKNHCQKTHVAEVPCNK